MNGNAEARPSSVYVFEAPVRLWHWVNAAAIVVLAVSGYFIGSPPFAGPGEASDHYLMGTIRFLHFAAGYVLAVGFLGRIYWALVGNHHARQMFHLPLRSASWWRDFRYELRWYALLERSPRKFVGHNPLAQASMLVLFVLGTGFMILTGFALYSEGTGKGSWQDALFGWVIPLLGGSQPTHTLHHLGMWLIVAFVIGHVYAAIREELLSRQSMVSTMISGWRTFRDGKPPE
ncbi:Ni/Fe-hydrogenase, b-type cytochrome subunit [Thiohalorhabdus methylotrophus]|uniref:Ni/Fe-hydrogenase, b-type cytochrome subunit n=1 Tax=Thiohalorhabdus methylotrophus TaxID=3242694 RepID=A0ABV4TWA6_9GAMM